MPVEKLKILNRYDSAIAHFLVNALEKADMDALHHSIATAELCHCYARHDDEAGLLPDSIWLAGFLHDIGKLGIPTRVLGKKGKLTKAERIQVNQHPAFGDLITRRLFRDNALSDAIYAHHERFDGTGYPKGLEGGEIPVVARVVSVASSYDAMRSAGWLLNRRSHEDALRELKDCAGTQFDPDVVTVFIRHEAAMRFAHQRARALQVDDVLSKL
jgi:HD-GYP domain-containing protein (c-di-GMP phosphodiesterase class II)